ncbi:MAG: MopE-related protein [Pseudomonadota bacterium]|nr:MopE-related protein [Pseudomonadota bacterium]
MRVWLSICLIGCAPVVGADSGPADPSAARCDGDTLPPTWYADLDGDGYGRATAARAACEAPDAYVDNADDCDDAHGAVFPGATERCNGLDDDCDGLGDDTDPDLSRAEWYQDADADGYGETTLTATTCAAPIGFVATPGDCADDDPVVYPGADDACGGGDDDCDGADDACTRAGEVSLDSADATLVGEAAGDGAGTVLALGDVDGDGIADVAVGAPRAEDDAGAAWVVRGPLLGERRLHDADLRIAGTRPDAPIGRVALGDLDGDTLADLVVATPLASTVWVFPGNATGAVALDTAPATRTGLVGDRAGADLAIGPDLDGDGLGDLVVGAPAAVGADGVAAGGVAIVAGPVAREAPLADAAAWLVGESAGADAGWAVASPGDLDGDGMADLLVGAPGARAPGDTAEAEVGAAYVVYGPLLGILALADADARFYGAAAGDAVGTTVAGVGDIDGDGVADVMVGGPGVDDAGAEAGAAWLVRGPARGDLGPADAHCTLLGDAEGQAAGTTLVPLGDLDADGRADVGLGGDGAERAWLLLGPFAGTIALTYAEVTLVGATPLDDAGAALAGGADADGDGGLDVLVGAPGADVGGSGAGGVALLRGWAP